MLSIGDGPVLVIGGVGARVEALFTPG